MWLNYAQLPGFLSLYMSSPGKWFDAFTGSMDFAGLALEVGRERIAVEGISILGEEPDPYTAALMSSGKAPMKAHSIMPARTAFYANVGFSDPKTFVAEWNQKYCSRACQREGNRRRSRDRMRKKRDKKNED